MLQLLLGMFLAAPGYGADISAYCAPDQISLYCPQTIVAGSTVNWSGTHTFLKPTGFGGVTSPVASIDTGGNIYVRSPGVLLADRINSYSGGTSYWSVPSGLVLQGAAPSYYSLTTTTGLWIQANGLRLPDNTILYSTAGLGGAVPMDLAVDSITVKYVWKSTDNLFHVNSNDVYGRREMRFAMGDWPVLKMGCGAYDGGCTPGDGKSIDSDGTVVYFPSRLDALGHYQADEVRLTDQMDYYANAFFLLNRSGLSLRKNPYLDEVLFAVDRDSNSLTYGNIGLGSGPTQGWRVSVWGDLKSSGTIEASTFNATASQYQLDGTPIIDSDRSGYFNHIIAKTSVTFQGATFSVGASTLSVNFGRVGVNTSITTGAGPKLEVNGGIRWGNTGTQSNGTGLGSLFMASGSSITVSSITASGRITAGSFQGDGSLLTNIGGGLQIFQATVTYSDFSVAYPTHTITLFTLPPGGYIVGGSYYTPDGFSGGSIGSYQLTLYADTAQLSNASDFIGPTGPYGFAVPFASPIPFYPMSSKAIELYADTAGASTLDEATDGLIRVWILYYILP